MTDQSDTLPYEKPDRSREGDDFVYRFRLSDNEGVLIRLADLYAKDGDYTFHVWISTYDLDPAVPAAARQLRCCECDPPSGRSFVGSKWMIVTRQGGQGGPGDSSGPGDGKPAWSRFSRGGGDGAPESPPDLAEPNDLADNSRPTDSIVVSQGGGGLAPEPRWANWDTWIELTLPDGSKALAPPGWRRINLLRVEMLFGHTQAWKILQRRTDAFFSRLPK